MDGIYLSYLRVNRGDNGGYLAGSSAPFVEGRETSESFSCAAVSEPVVRVGDQEVLYLTRGDSTREATFVTAFELFSVQRTIIDHVDQGSNRIG